MMSTLTLQKSNKRTFIKNGIDSLRSNLSLGFQKLLDEALKQEAAKLPRKLETKAVDELISIFSDILLHLSVTVSLPSVQDVKKKLQNGALGIYSKLIPMDEDLKELENVVCRSSKKKKQFFHGPVDKVYNMLKEIYPNIKPNVAYYIYGVAEKMIFSILKSSVYYEENSQLNDPIIQETTIQTVVKLYERQNTTDSKISPSIDIPSDYDKCVDQLRTFLQSSYDQCHTILRVFFDPVKSFLPVSTKQVHRLVNSFMNIFRALLESIEDMNDHVSSGGSGRMTEQGLIGYCFEAPAEDYLLDDFTTYTSCVINGQCLSDLLLVVENEEAIKLLMSKGRSILQTIITKYEYNHRSGWPWLHKGCVHCNGLQTGSMVNEAFVVNEHVSAETLDSVSTNHACYTDCNYLLNCYIYLFPKLLLVPIFQFLYLEEIIKHLFNLSYNEEDRISLKDVSSDFHITRQKIIQIIKNVPDLDVTLNRLSSLYLKEFRPQCRDLELLVDRKVAKLEEFEILGPHRLTELGAYHNSEFIMNGKLFVQSDNKKMISRMVYLFHNVLLIYKWQESGWKQPLSGQNAYMKLKRIIPLDCIHMIDARQYNHTNVGSMFEIHLDSFGTTNFHSEDNLGSFEQKSKSATYFGFRMQFQDLKLTNGSLSIQTLNFATHSYEEKADWLSCLLHIQTYRLYEKYIKELPKQEIPLRLPDPVKYKYAEPDSDDNIRFEKPQNDDFFEISDEEEAETDDMPIDEIDVKKNVYCGHPQIKYATLHKLIERLTYHTYHDSRALHMFLLAYRRFTTPDHLLDLLIERFNIPLPDFSSDERLPEWKDEPSAADQMLKRFKNSYQRRVQRRVIWVILKWIQNPGFFRYAFANQPQQIKKLLQFVNAIKTKELQNACEIIRENCNNHESIYSNYELSSISSRTVPSTLNWDIAKKSSDIRLTNIHPVELARQITLFEWDLYHRIQYWEVEGKETTTDNTPNLNRSKEFSNKLRNWFVYSILSEEHPDDRSAVIMRVADIMMLCDHWHNLQGSQEARAALISASVFRLKKTFDYITRRYRNYKNVFNSMRKGIDGGKLNKTIYTQEYEQNIQRIEESNPPVPCVPFIAFGTTTKLIHAELKSNDTINVGSGAELINFRKHRRLSQIIERYLSFQRLSYEFTPDQMILGFLETLDPFAMVGAKNDDDFEKYMFEISERYEPRDSESNVFSESFQEKERRLTKIELKNAEQLNNMSLKEKLDLQKLNNVSYSVTTSTSRSTSTMSTSTIGSEPTTPTNSSTLHLDNQSLKFDNYTLDKLPHNKYCHEPSLTSSLSSSDSANHVATPPLPPRAKDMSHNNDINNCSPSFSLPPPLLPPRATRLAPPPIPTRSTK